MYFHSQNLTDDVWPGKEKGLWRHGRAWWHIAHRWGLHAEWSILCNPSFHIGLELGGFSDDTIAFRLGLILFRIYLGANLGRWHPKHRECEIYWREWGLGLKFWASEDYNWNDGHKVKVKVKRPKAIGEQVLVMTSGAGLSEGETISAVAPNGETEEIEVVRHIEPWYQKTWHFDIKDFIFGRQECETREGQDRIPLLIPMPEGCYPAHVKREHRIWRRKGFLGCCLKPLERHSLWVEMDGMIPFEGKGENSWDCGEDGLRSCGIDVGPVERPSDVPRAIAHVVATVLEKRKRYGGSYTHKNKYCVLVDKQKTVPADSKKWNPFIHNRDWKLGP